MTTVIVSVNIEPGQLEIARGLIDTRLDVNPIMGKIYVAAEMHQCLSVHIQLNYEDLDYLFGTEHDLAHPLASWMLSVASQLGILKHPELLRAHGSVTEYLKTGKHKLRAWFHLTKPEVRIEAGKIQYVVRDLNMLSRKLFRLLG